MSTKPFSHNPPVGGKPSKKVHARVTVDLIVCLAVCVLSAVGAVFILLHIYGPK